jgi:GxxExxY protein
MTENEIGTLVVDAGFTVHSRLGPGLLESVYETILVHELKKRGLRVKQQVALPIIYDDIRIDEGYRMDIVVEDKVVIELKSVDKVLPVHKKQLLTYLKLTGKHLGYLINFNEDVFRDGITRLVLGLPE